jgi:hypothetical protein
LYRVCQSERAVKQNIDQCSNFGKPYSGWINYNGTNFRSKWEADFAKKLDELNIEWEYEKCRFPYTKTDGSKSQYIVDFYIPCLDLFVEIKAIYFINEETGNKLKAVRDRGKNIVLLTEKNRNDFYKILENNNLWQLLTLPLNL